MANLDALLPPEIALKAEEVGVSKANTGWVQLLVLAILAGAFISLGAIFYTVVTAGSTPTLPYSIVRLYGGIAFSLGLILVIVGGAELFTGNTLIIMSLAAGKITVPQLLRNWGVVYIGNMIGALGTALLVILSGIFMNDHGEVGLNMLQIASAKCNLGFTEAIALGVLCNTLVCLAVWLCFSARFVTGKILAIIFPISAFVTAGFEHSVANMYFIPAALLLKSTPQETFWITIGATPSDYMLLTWGQFVWSNLLPVTLGNILGGGVLVGLVYWFIYIRPLSSQTSA